MSGYGDYPKFKVAAVQASPIVKDAPQWFDLESTVDKATSLIAEAGEKGARLIVFPECWLPCYPYWSMDITDRSGFAEIWASLLRSSVEVPGRVTEALCNAAKGAGAFVVMGINERDRMFPGRMYNSILYLSPRGEVIGTHRKICITVHERFFHTPGDGGNNLKTVFRTEIGNLGGSICGEHMQLTLMHNWIMQGLEVHCSLWPGMSEVVMPADLHTRAICRQGHAFGVLSATYMPENNMPKNFYKNCYFNIPGSIRGGSGVISPYGEYIAGPVFDEETIVYADVDLADIDKARYPLNLTGIYSRWDLFSLKVRQETYEPLVPMEAPEEALIPSKSDRIRELEARVKQLEQQITALSGEKAKSHGDKR